MEDELTKAMAVAGVSGQSLDSRSVAEALDAFDELSSLRGEFHLPEDARHGRPYLYFCGNSLGLQPKSTRAAVDYELDQWAARGVEGHFHGSDASVRPWLHTDENVHSLAARVVGARPSEVAVMNGLTTNLHLMMVAFYRPTAARHRVIIEARSFPSDLYAVESQIRMRGFDPAASLVELRPREGEATLRMDDVEAAVRAAGESLALVMLSGVQYLTGQYFDIPRVVRAAHSVGAMAGFDCAHAAGNVPLQLHDWDCDFAVWCSYKYLNSGPGGIAGAFVHERHAHRRDLDRLAGWWGHALKTRFDMDQPFEPIDGAFGYRLSNPPVLQIAAHLASLRIFERAGGMAPLRNKSLALTRYLERRLHDRLGDRADVLTPADPAQRGCQLSVRFLVPGPEVLDRLMERGVIVDVRKPDVVRIAPAPLYNSFTDVYDLVEILADVIQQ